MKKRLLGLIQWWMQLEPIEHRHWCLNRACYHSSIAWRCEGALCAHLEKKDCPNCKAGKPKTCKGTFGPGAARCTCGWGRD